MSSARASQMTPPAVIVKAEDVVSPEMSPARAFKAGGVIREVRAGDISGIPVAIISLCTRIVRVRDDVSPEMSPARTSQMTPPDRTHGHLLRLQNHE